MKTCMLVLVVVLLTLTTGRVSGQVIASSTVTGKFKLHFEQNSIFDTSVPMRTVTCQVFNDVSNFINSNIPNGSINIWCYDAGGSLGYGTPSYAFPSNPINPNAGFVDGMVYKALVSGTDPFLNMPLNFYNPGLSFFHGSIQANPTAVWNYNLNTTSINPSEYDAYTYMLHESMHVMGIHTAITNTNGASMFNDPLLVSLNMVNNNYYTRYDRFLFDNAGGPLIAPVDPLCPLSGYTFAPASSSVIAMTQSLSNTTSDVTNCLIAARYSGTHTFSVYTPNGLEAGSSLAHFEDMCSHPSNTTTCTGPTGDWNNLYFVMANKAMPGSCYVRRHLNDLERSVLCDLGYSVNATFGGASVAGSAYSYSAGACYPAITVYGNNDGLAGTVYTLQTTTGNTIIPFSTLLANDLPSTGLSLTCLELVGPSGATFTQSATHFTVQSPSGLTTFKYYPKHTASGTLGNAAYVTIYFVPPGCVSCNHISNGGFEYSNSAPSTWTCGSLWAGFAPLRWLDCWTNYQPAPFLASMVDLYSSSCPPVAGNFQLGVNTNNLTPPINAVNLGTTPNSQCIALRHSGYPPIGAMRNTLNMPLAPSGQYKASFWVVNPSSGPSNINTPGNPVVITLASSPAAAPTGSNNFPSGLHVIKQSTVAAGSAWTQVTYTFVYTPTVAAQSIIIGIDGQQTPPPSTVSPFFSYYCFLDELSIEPLSGPTFTVPATPLCIGQGLSNLATYASTVGVFSGAGVSSSGPGQYDFNLTGTLSPGIYPIAFTYNTGYCSNTIYASVTVTACCMSGINHTYANTTVNSNATWSGGNVIANSLTVQPGVTLQLTDDLVMSSNVKITIAPGAAVVVNDAHMHTCGNYLWQGFEVLDGGVLIMTNTGGDNLIEDAVIAIDASNQATTTIAGVLQVSHTTFNKNYIDIKISDYNQTIATYPFSITNCVFTCRDLLFTSSAWPQTGIASSAAGAGADLRYVDAATTPTTGLASPYLNQPNFNIVNLKSPYNTQRSHIAIQLNNMGVTSGGTMYGPVIGSSATATGFNVFDAHGQFISAVNSHVTSRNNVFQNTQTYTLSGIPLGGSAISHSTGTVFNTQLQLSAPSVDVGNRFWNCHRGVEGKNIYRLWTDNALFRSTQTNTNNVFGQGNTGLTLNTNRVEYYIGYTEFTNIKIGINVALAPGSYTYASNTPGSGIYADRLRITNNTFSSGSAALINAHMDRAVYISAVTAIPFNAVINNSVSPVVNALAITNNVITEAYKGIYVTGISGFPTAITNNQISLLENLAAPGAQSGIHLTNTSPASAGGVLNYGTCIVANNTADFSPPAVNTNSAGALIWCGFNLFAAQSPSVTCNEVSNGYQGFVFENANTGTYWGGNVMSDLGRGLVLATSGNIGIQGGATTAINDQWNNVTADTYADNTSNPANSPLYVRNTTGLIPVTNLGTPWNYSQSNCLFSPSFSGDYNCYGIPNYKTVNPVYNDDGSMSAEHLFMAELNLYLLLSRNDSVLNSDPVLIDFYNERQETTVGKFARLESLMYETESDELWDVLGSMDENDLNAVESSYYNFYALYAAYLTNGTLTEAQKNALYYLASQCPSTHGAIVYQAAALYNALYGIIIEPDCDGVDGARLAVAGISDDKAAAAKRWDVQLYPNPANTQITLSGSQASDIFSVTIRDLSGRELLQKTVRTKDFSASLDLDLMNGAYMVTIENGNKQRTTKKLLIAR